MEEVFKRLGHKAKRVRLHCDARSSTCADWLQADIEDMIWEVDDDCDKAVTWSEFQALFQRCRNDKTGAWVDQPTPPRKAETRAGYEPRRLYNVAEFLMNDKDNSGKVSVEEVMQILFLRYGRQLLDSQLEEMFGTSDTNSGTGDLSLTEFLVSLSSSQNKQRPAASKTRAAGLSSSPAGPARR